MGEHWSYCLMHHGILGQKWGVRRFQNADGSVTAAGAKRYYTGQKRNNSEEYTKGTGKVNSKALVNDLKKYYESRDINDVQSQDVKIVKSLKNSMTKKQVNSLNKSRKEYLDAYKKVVNSDDKSYEEAYKQLEKIEKKFDNQIKKTVNTILDSDIANMKLKDISSNAIGNGDVKNHIEFVLNGHLKNERIRSSWD